MLPDTGERYLSTPLFEDIDVEHERSGARALALDTRLPLRRAGAPGTDRRDPAAGAGGRARRGGRALSSTRRRPGSCRRDVRARVVRVLLVRAQAVRAARHRLPERRPRLGRVPGARPGREDPRRAQGPHRLADHPADLHRRQARRRLHGPVRRDARRPDAAATSTMPASSTTETRTSIPTASCRSGCIRGRRRDPHSQSQGIRSWHSSRRYPRKRPTMR